MTAEAAALAGGEGLSPIGCSSESHPCGVPSIGDSLPMEGPRLHHGPSYGLSESACVAAATPQG